MPTTFLLLLLACGFDQGYGVYDRLRVDELDPSDLSLQMVNGFSGAFQPNSNQNPLVNNFSGQFQFLGQGQMLSSAFVSKRSMQYSGFNAGTGFLKVGDETTISSVKYQILKELGAGTYGNVYLAEDPSGKKVAIKVPKVVKGDTNNVVGEEAKHEIQMLALMEHNKLAVHMLNHGDITTEARPNIVIEYTPFGSLADQLGKTQRTVGQRISCAFKLMKDAAVGLVPMKIVSQGKDLVGEDEVSMVVRHDMAHGDVKPGNFLVFKPDKSLAKHYGSVVFKVGDWGSAHLFTDQTWDKLKGTVAYMAPEVLEAGGLCTNTLCDVWSTAMSVVDLVHDTDSYVDKCKMLGLQFACTGEIHMLQAVKQWRLKNEQERMAQIQAQLKSAFGQSQHKQIGSLEYMLHLMLRPDETGQYKRATWPDVMNIKNDWTTECTPELFPEG